MTELEAFAVVWALESFRAYVEGSPALVHTDHSPLPWIRNNRGTKVKIGRWALALQNYAFDLTNRAGITHNVPDALSRYPTGKPGEEHEFMFDECLPGEPGAFVATAAPFPIEDETGNQHAFSAGGGREAKLQRHVPCYRPGERRQTAEASFATCGRLRRPVQRQSCFDGFWIKFQGLSCRCGQNRKDSSRR